jgi:hypothetical protein
MAQEGTLERLPDRCGGDRDNGGVARVPPVKAVGEASWAMQVAGLSIS